MSTAGGVAKPNPSSARRGSRIATRHTHNPTCRSGGTDLAVLLDKHCGCWAFAPWHVKSTHWHTSLPLEHCVPELPSVSQNPVAVLHVDVPHSNAGSRIHALGISSPGTHPSGPHLGATQAPNTPLHAVSLVDHSPEGLCQKMLPLTCWSQGHSQTICGRTGDKEACGWSGAGREAAQWLQPQREEPHLSHCHADEREFAQPCV